MVRVATDGRVPSGNGDLLVGALRARLLSWLDIKDGALVGEQQLFEGAFGRIRDVRIAADGAIWVLTDDDNGGSVRITAAGGGC